jgi:AbrB family looped-hinge helix DNA binding protein
MANRVGTKGQIVIEKAIRDQLGIQPGWKAYQQVVDGRLEISFRAPDHRESLAGVLSKYVKRSVSAEEWHDAKEAAVGEGVAAEYAESMPVIEEKAG